jgi:hypothetical protein
MKSPSISPDLQDDTANKKPQSEELKQIKEALNAIRMQIDRHIEFQSAASDIIKQPQPQWFPQSEDWDQRSFEKWLRSLIPIQSKLERIRLKFFASLSNSTTNLRVSIGVQPDDYPIRTFAPTRQNAAPMIVSQNPLVLLPWGTQPLDCRLKPLFDAWPKHLAWYPAFHDPVLSARALQKQVSHIDCPEEDLYWVFAGGEKDMFVQICRMEYDDEGCPGFVSESCLQESRLPVGQSPPFCGRSVIDSSR